MQQASNGLAARMTKKFAPIKEYFVFNYGISQKKQDLDHFFNDTLGRFYFFYYGILIVSKLMIVV